MFPSKSDLYIWKIPLSDIDYGPEEVEAVERVLRSKWLSMGPEVEAFEAEFAVMQGTKHAIADGTTFLRSDDANDHGVRTRYARSAESDPAAPGIV